MFELKEKTAIVTGGGSGIGTAIAQRLRKAGANVVIADITDETADKAKEWGCEFIKTDASRPEEIKSLCDAVVKKHGKLDIMINNAGIASGRPLSESDEVQSEKYWRLHILGVQTGIKEAAARMTDGGAIVNISSITAIQGFLNWGEYAATKAGIISLTRTAAIEYGKAKIRVNCIAPGIIETPMAMKEAPDMVARNANLFAPLGRIGTPDELAAAVHFMASDDASYITGQVLLVDGGWSVGTSVQAIELAIGTM